MNAVLRRVARSVVGVSCAVASAGLLAAPARADEIWVAPTYQQDLGGLGIASNGLWPVTAAGAVRLAWGVPDDLHTFQSAKIALIPHAPGGAATLNIFVCRAQAADMVAASCVGPIPHGFTGVANQLVEVDVSGAIGPQIGAPGLTYLAVVAYTVPTTATDHIVGLRFGYAPRPVATAALADAAVTAAKVAPGAVDESKLSFDPATQSELTGAIAAARITSVNDLAGLNCRHDGEDGTTVVVVESDGRVTLNCHVPPCCTLDQPTWDAFGQFVTELPPTVVPTRIFSYGDCGLFSTLGCIRIEGSTSGVTATWRSITGDVVDERREWTDYRLAREVVITTASPLTVQYKNVGPAPFDTCTLSVTGTRTLSETVRSEIVMTSLGTHRRLSRPGDTSSTFGNLTFSGCELVRNDLTGPVYQELRDFIRAQLAFQPLCWPDGTTQFGACPVP